jgi:hypothetical protein
VIEIVLAFWGICIVGFIGMAINQAIYNAERQAYWDKRRNP